MFPVHPHSQIERETGTTMEEPTSQWRDRELPLHSSGRKTRGDYGPSPSPPDRVWQNNDVPPYVWVKGRPGVTVVLGTECSETSQNNYDLHYLRIERWPSVIVVTVLLTPRRTKTTRLLPSTCRELWWVSLWFVSYLPTEGQVWTTLVFPFHPCPKGSRNRPHPTHNDQKTIIRWEKVKNRSSLSEIPKNIRK